VVVHRVVEHEINGFWLLTVNVKMRCKIIENFIEKVFMIYKFC